MNKIFSYIDDHKEDMISDLARLVKIPSVMGEAEENAPFGKYPAAALAEALDVCSEAGLSVKNIGNYIGTADFYQTENIPELGILVHMDVVPVGDGWSSDPFELTRRDGKLFGRGAIDDKGPAIAALYALKAVKESGVKLSKNVRLILGTNEENGSNDLARYKKIESLPEILFTPDGSYPLINTEKGMMRLTYSAEVSPKIISAKGGNAVNAVPEYAEAILDVQQADTAKFADKFEGVTISAENSDGKIKITARGKGAHASTPENGRNAVTALLAVIAEITGDKAAAALSAMFPYGETDGNAAGIKCSDEISGGLTTVLSVLDVGGGKLEARQDIRFPASKASGEVLEMLQKTADGNGLGLTVNIASEPHHVPESSEFIRTLLKVYEEATGEKGYCVAIGGGTYVHDTKGGVAFGAEFPGDENNMHGADEFITEESLVKNAKIFAAAIVRLCADE